MLDPRSPQERSDEIRESCRKRSLFKARDWFPRGLMISGHDDDGVFPEAELSQSSIPPWGADSELDEEIARAAICLRRCPSSGLLAPLPPPGWDSRRLYAHISGGSRNASSNPMPQAVRC